MSRIESRVVALLPLDPAPYRFSSGRAIACRNLCSHIRHRERKKRPAEAGPGRARPARSRPGRMLDRAGNMAHDAQVGGGAGEEEGDEHQAGNVGALPDGQGLRGSAGHIEGPAGDGQAGRASAPRPDFLENHLRDRRAVVATASFGGGAEHATEPRQVR